MQWLKGVHIVSKTASYLENDWLSSSDVTRLSRKQKLKEKEKRIKNISHEFGFAAAHSSGQ